MFSDCERKKCKCVNKCVIASQVTKSERIVQCSVCSNNVNVRWCKCVIASHVTNPERMVPRFTLRVYLSRELLFWVVPKILTAKTEKFNLETETTTETLVNSFKMKPYVGFYTTSRLRRWNQDNININSTRLSILKIAKCWVICSHVSQSKHLSCNPLSKTFFTVRDTMT